MLRSACYDELELMLAKDMSYRLCTLYLNRLRWQDAQNGIKTRTLADAVVREGEMLIAYIDTKAQAILVQNQFDPRLGTPQIEAGVKHTLDAPASQGKTANDIKQAIEEHNEGRDPKYQMNPKDAEDEVFECAAESVYVSADDVGVKEQKPSGRQKNPPPKRTKPRVKNTVIHIQQGLQRYVLDGIGVRNMLVILTAFLLHNNLFSQRTLIFFADGADDIKNGIRDIFGWRPYRVILDWFHLVKKCKERSSMAMKGRHVRNELLKTLLGLLWLGRVSEAIAYLQNLDSNTVRCSEHIDKLIAYLERNRGHIPCYALRKQLGLRISSNRGEKANDLVVAKRQKHNGMSWSKPGSSSLANITALFLNEEQENWLTKRELDFRLIIPGQEVA